MTAAIARSLIALALLGVGLAPVPGHGAHGDSCEVSWAANGLRDCGVSFTGAPVTIYADACRNANCVTGTSSVRAWITISTLPIVIAECSAEGPGLASCTAELSSGTAWSTLAGTVPLTCNVSGTRGGFMSCGSGCIDPSQGPVCEVLASPPPAS